MTDASQYKILVVGPSWVGDMIMSQSLYKILRRRYPDALIDVMAPPSALAMVSRMAEVSRGIKFDMPHGELALGKRQAFGEALKKNGYDQAIILPNSLKSALVPFHADIPIRTAFRGEFRYFLVNDMRLMHKRTMPKMIDRFAALGVKLGQKPKDIPYPELTVDKENQVKLMTSLGLNTERGVLGICPGAEFGDAKQWPERHYAETAKRAIEKGMQVWIFGGPKDKETSQRIKQAIGDVGEAHCTDLSGETSLLDVVDLIALCDQVISNDSGLMHVAAAVGVNTAVIYGSTSPGFTPPLTDKLDVISIPMDCAPCFKRSCPLGHKKCLEDLSADLLDPVLDRVAPSQP